ncbi:MAG TPA: HAMP domain-containing sensor histidine kinase [Spirochaetia bacterium]|nr:HAMP domain-containing sensor histidine kinase [Spirochaetia bacterium]
MKRFLRRWPILLVAILLTAGGVVLAALQVQWARSAARAEEERLYASLTRGARQAAIEAEDEIGVIESMALSAAAGYSTQDWSRLTASLRLWQRYAPFPELLHGLYVVQTGEPAQVFEYSRAESRLISAALPVNVQDALQGTLASGPERWRTTVLRGAYRITVVPALGNGLPSRPGRSVVAIVMVLDTRVLYEKILPRLVATDLGDCPFRIVAADARSIIAQSPGLPAGRHPDVAISVTSAPFGGTTMPWESFARPPNGDLPQPQRLRAAPFDPFLQSWLQRVQGNASAARAIPEVVVPAEPEATLQIFYPGASIDATARLRQAVNVGVSLGILSLLIASVFVLMRLYAGSLAVRAREQEFVASVTHELRTPLAVIQATSQNLTRGVVSDPSRRLRYAEVIYDQVRRLSRMLEGVLLYAGFQSAKARPPALAEFDARVLIQDILQPLSHLASERGSILRLEFRDLPARIRSDRMALGIVLENLVVNGIRHADPGEVRVRVAVDEARILSVVVEDDGPGIPFREQARIFGPFVRGERSVREQVPGSGLGLHLVQRVVTILGGTVRLQSPYPIARGASHPGCRFQVTLPFEEVEHHD